MKFIGIIIFVLIGVGSIVVMQAKSRNQCKFIPITTPNGQIITAETARTSAEQRQGLSNRESLPSANGMLFLFEKKDYYTFWMKDTYIPLDIIWLNEKKIVDIQRLSPGSDSNIPQYTPTVLADAVLELATGQASQYQIEVGSQLIWDDSCSKLH